MLSCFAAILSFKVNKGTEVKLFVKKHLDTDHKIGNNMIMKQNGNLFLVIFLIVCIAFSSCVSIGDKTVQVGETTTADGITLDEAIEQSTANVIVKLPKRTRIAIVAFSAEHDNLSNYIMDELAGAFVDGSLEVADRRNLNYVYRELNFQMSGDVSDETAVSIGKFLGARYVITGQFIKAGNHYRYRLSSINIETAIQESSTRLNVRNDRTLQSLIADVRQMPVVTASADYNERQNVQPVTAGTFLDRGILFASRSDWDAAIADYSESIRLNPNNTAAYINRGAAYAFKGNFDRAIADYNQAISLDQNNAIVYLSRGMAFAYKSDFDRAIADYNQAIRLNLNNEMVYAGRAMAYAHKGDFDRAIADYNQAIKYNQNNAMLYAGRGMAYHHKGNFDNAIADYEMALRINPNDKDTKNNLEIARRRVQ